MQEVNVANTINKSKIFQKIYKNKIIKICLNICIIIILALNIFPFIMLIFGALKNNSQFYAQPYLPTLPIDFSYLVAVAPLVGKYVMNTIIVAIFGIAGNLFISGLSAYVFARLKFFGKEFLFYLIIMLMMVPSILVIVPNYHLYLTFHLENTLLALILPMVTTGPIFGTFLLRGFFEGIPEEIFEAARVDGASEFRLFISMCIPISIPIFGTLAIMNVISVWNDVIWPNLINSDKNYLTIGAGLLNIVNTTTTINYPFQFAAYLFASLPVIILFIFATRFYIDGLSSSGLKM